MLAIGTVTGRLASIPSKVSLLAVGRGDGSYADEVGQGDDDLILLFRTV